MPGVFVNGKMDAFEFEKIQLTNNAILAFMKINGQISVTVNGLE